MHIVYSSILLFVVMRRQLTKYALTHCTVWQIGLKLCFVNLPTLSCMMSTTVDRYSNTILNHMICNSKLRAFTFLLFDYFFYYYFLLWDITVLYCGKYIIFYKIAIIVDARFRLWWMFAYLCQKYTYWNIIIWICF